MFAWCRLAVLVIVAATVPAFAQDQRIQLAEDRASDLGYSTLKSYVCQYLMNEFAEAEQKPANVVRAEAFSSEGGSSESSGQTRFGNDGNDDVCGRVTFPATLTKKLGDTYVRVAERLRSIAGPIAETFLPDAGGKGSRDFAEVTRIIADFRQEITDEVKAMKPLKSGEADQGLLPEAEGPDKDILDRDYPSAAKIYAEFLKWLVVTAGK